MPTIDKPFGAIRWGNLQATRGFLVHHINFFYTSTLTESSPNKTMPTIDKLFEAIRWGDLQATRQLLEGNDDLGVDTSGGPDLAQRTPLHQACKYGKLHIARYLVHDQKANVDAVECDGLTPLLQTCNAIGTLYVEHSMELVNLLLTSGANVNGKALRIGDSTALHQACCWGAGTRMVQLLLDHGAHINARDFYGRTPLYYACGMYHPCEDVVKLLLANNADRHILNCSGRGPMDELQRRNLYPEGLTNLFASYDTLSLTAPVATTTEYIIQDGVGFLNPQLSQHQHALAVKALLLVRKLPVHEVACEILGFLSPAAVEKALSCP